MNRLDLKALRIGLHGWWLGNPLVYKPGAADLVGIARELASAGAASGTLVLSDLSDANENDDCRDHVRAILILRLPESPEQLGEAAAHSIAEVIEGAFGNPCVIHERWEIALRDRTPPLRACQLKVEAHDGVAFLDMRLDLGRLSAMEQEQRQGQGSDGPAAALLARPDWREVLLARVLHALDVRLSSLRGH
jgi:hypothetical protein